MGRNSDFNGENAEAENLCHALNAGQGFKVRI